MFLWPSLIFCDPPCVSMTFLVSPSLLPHLLWPSLCYSYHPLTFCNPPCVVVTLFYDAVTRPLMLWPFFCCSDPFFVALTVTALQDCLYHHPVHKISFMAQDMTDTRAFGYIFGSPDSGHKFFGIKSEKAASQVVIAMRDLFQVSDACQVVYIVAQLFSSFLWVILDCLGSYIFHTACPRSVPVFYSLPWNR